MSARMRTKRAGETRQRRAVRQRAPTPSVVEDSRDAPAFDARVFRVDRGSPSPSEGRGATAPAPTASCTPVSLSPDVNLLSVDLEPWPGGGYREEALFLLDLFRERKAKATFFVLSCVAEEDPDLVRQIDREGHEVASHGYSHRPIHTMTKETFAEEMRRAVDLLSEVVGKPVLGFRAPIFSIVPRSWWALKTLLDVGIQYDSSIFPMRGPRYGIPSFPRHAVRVPLGDRSIIEVPLSTVRKCGINLPVAGGGYFRLLPYPLIRHAFRTVNAEGFPFVVYCHPYEFHQRPLRLPHRFEGCGYWKRRLLETKQNLFRWTMRAKLASLLDQFRFSSFREALGNEIRS